MSDGNRQPRRFPIGLIAIAVLVLIGVLATTIPFFTYATWVGRKELPVHVIVIDADTLKPIADAGVVIFTGPHSPLEGVIAIYSTSNFSAENEDAEPQYTRTDNEGRAVLTRRFFAAGRPRRGSVRAFRKRFSTTAEYLHVLTTMRVEVSCDLAFISL